MNPKRALSPQNHKVFDSWNSASTGHQRAQSGYAGSSGWRDTRALKLERQFHGGDCLREKDHAPAARSQAFDGTCVSDSEEDKRKMTSVNGHEEWRWVSDAEAMRSQLNVRDIRHFMGIGKRKANDEIGNGDKKLKVEDFERQAKPKSATEIVPSNSTTISNSTPTDEPRSIPLPKSVPDTKIFAGMTIFINGSTLPLISDHKLKQLLVKHGAQISIYMARKTVSHVIIGQPNTDKVTENGLGAGGGLSARKLQQEIARGGWKGVKIISVDWALESIKAGKRLAESRFTVLNVAQKGQQSISGLFARQR
ncbi:uncharacterized protein N7483_004745 [Penicillium malachiteum]|uniref:uncharacterized protein n=1 Tax=Penicillium malachiteum TaxID=1324776 RepID=UPI002546605A|nr:uncharacterized protein N7483_004745 [Penicillium malachiteum]KAJ5730237.1 hypothetical protein N7483_004745 [Penicillium malachiteum]